MDQIKKAKSDGMSEDDQKFWEESVQEITDKAIKEIEELRLFKTKAVTIFAVVQFCMAAAVAASKIF